MLRRRRAAWPAPALLAAGLLCVLVAGALAARAGIVRPAPLGGLLLGLALAVAGGALLRPGARGAVAVLDAEGLRDGAGRVLCRWADVGDADLEVRRASPRDVYTERLALRGGGAVDLDLSTVDLPPLEVHKAVRARLSPSRGVSRPSAAARERARELLRDGRVEDALAAFNQALGLDPDDALSLHGRAGAYRARGDDERAEADLNDAIRRAPDLPAAHLERAALRLRRGRPQLALEDLARVLELRPGDPEALALRAQALAAL